MGESELVRSLRLQLRIERAVILLVALLLVGRWGYSHFHMHRADRNPIAASGTVQAAKYAILVDGTPIAAVGSEEDAGAVLEAIKSRYGSMVKHLMEEPQFKQDVKVQLMAADKRICYATVDEAVDAIAAKGSGSGVYTVSNGDIAGSISDRFHMTLSELKSLNGGKKLDKLKIGDQIRVSRTHASKKAGLVVIVRDQESETEMLPFHTEMVSSMQLRPGKQHLLNEGRNGLRKVVRAVTYENGIRTGMEVVDEKMIRPAVPRRVAVGIKKGKV
jgi:LysM repeat protein